MKPTPGPWTVSNEELIYTFGIYEDGWFIAEVMLPEDANLMAAAPELLEALEELCVLVEDARTGDYKIDSLTLQPARAAIAKAKGES